MSGLPVWQFALRVLAWLPVCFAAWYVSAHFSVRPVAMTSRVIAQSLYAGVVKNVEVSGSKLDFVTTVQAMTEGGRHALLAPEVDSLAYTFGDALFLALMLASGAAWHRIALGLVVLVPFQAWGITFDALSQVVRASPLFVGTPAISRSSYDLIAAGYQFGSLVFPTVVPVLVWGLFCRRSIESMTIKSFRTGGRDPGTKPASPVRESSK